MDALAKEEITQLLNQWAAGDSDVENQLMHLVRPLLRQLSGQMLQNRRSELQPTELVNELYIQLVDKQKPQVWDNRKHFLAISGKLMRQILVDEYRTRSTAKRGAFSVVVPLEEEDMSKQDRLNPSELDDALNDLERIKPRMVRVVELKYFAGLTFEEIAEALNLSPSTVKRDWQLARCSIKEYMESTQPSLINESKPEA